MKNIAIGCAGLALLTTLGACSSTPRSAEDYLSSQRLQSAPFELTTTDRGQVLTLTDVLFDFEESTLRTEASGIIEQAASLMKADQSRVAVIEGHTDHTGSRQFNFALSEARSQAVRDALVAQGVPASRISTQGFGEAKPVATNVTRNGRQQNRRVEIIFKSTAETTVTLL